MRREWWIDDGDGGENTLCQWEGGLVMGWWEENFVVLGCGEVDFVG